MQPLSTHFTAFEFTAAELEAAQQFTPLQIAFLQTELAAKAHTRLQLQFDPMNPYALMQEESYLKGQMELLESLLNPLPTMEDPTA